mmetsp:Transcript_9942/g.21840  ORF Transcript_9942/g.21840 Transcript_9942/m.21840 type:complete len:138 (+) Transcript_9942:1551-1964(+)
MSYLSPPDKSVPGVMKEIGKIRDVDAPDTFGLPADVEKNIMRYKTIEITAQLKLIQSSSKDAVDKVELANSLFTFWQTQLTKIDKADAQSLDVVCQDPLENWVTIELSKVFRLIKTINETLKGLKANTQGAGLSDST